MYKAWLVLLVVAGCDTGGGGGTIDAAPDAPPIPVEALDELIRGVEKRADDELPTRIPPQDWFPPAADGPTEQG